MTASDSKCRGGVYPRPKKTLHSTSSSAGLDSTQLIAGRTDLESLLLTFLIY